MEFEIIGDGKIEVLKQGEPFMYGESKAGLLRLTYKYYMGDTLLLRYRVKYFLSRKFEILEQNLPFLINVYKENGYLSHSMDFSNHRILVKGFQHSPPFVIYLDEKEIAQVYTPAKILFGYQKWYMTTQTNVDSINVMLLLAFLMQSMPM